MYKTQFETTNAVSTAKVIMMYLVVFGHSIAGFSGSGWGGIDLCIESTLLKWVFLWLSTLHTYVFAVASGYLFSLQRYGRGKYRTLRKDLLHRLCKLMIPYLAVSVFWAIPFDILLKKDSLYTIVRNYVLMVDPAQLWFLVMLFWVWIIFYFFSDIIARIPVWGGVLVFLFIRIIGVYASQVLPLGLFSVGNELRYSLFFYIGFVMHKNNALRLTNRTVWVLIPVYVVLFILWTKTENVLISELMITLISVIGCSVVIKACTYISTRAKRNSLFSLFEKNSMGIYLIHQQILYCSMRILNIPDIPIILFVAGNAGIGLIISLLLAILIRKNKVGRFILGG